MTATAVGGAFVAGCLALLGGRDLLRAGLAVGADRAPGVARRVAGLAGLAARAGNDGRDPGAGERRQLLAGAAVVAFAVTTVTLGPLAGAAAAACGPWLVGRVLGARRDRYRARVDEGAGVLALSLADALGGGHSLRGALAEAGAGLEGAVGQEVRRTAAELEVGASTEGALESLRQRAMSPRIDTIVAAALLQRRAGGDLAALLRSTARGFEDQARLEGEVRAATAQARLTGLIVVLLPLGGALLTELASPGFLRGLAGSFLTAWLVGIALVLQVVAAVAIRRLGRVSE